MYDSCLSLSQAQNLSHYSAVSWFIKCIYRIQCDRYNNNVYGGNRRRRVRYDFAQHYNNNNNTHSLSLHTHTVWMIVEWEDPPKSQKIPWRELGFLHTIARK